MYQLTQRELEEIEKVYPGQTKKPAFVMDVREENLLLTTFKFRVLALNKS